MIQEPPCRNLPYTGTHTHVNEPVLHVGGFHLRECMMRVTIGKLWEDACECVCVGDTSWTGRRERERKRMEEREREREGGKNAEAMACLWTGHVCKLYHMAPSKYHHIYPQTYNMVTNDSTNGVGVRLFRVVQIFMHCVFFNQYSNMHYR